MSLREIAAGKISGFQPPSQAPAVKSDVKVEQKND
jgi:hypothetical protein